MERVDKFYNELPNTLVYQRYSKMYNNYNGLPGDFDPFDVSQLGQVGAQGALTSVRVPHLASIGEAMVRITTQVLPTWEPHPINSDVKSQEQVLVCKNLLDYYMDVRRLADRLVEMVETAVVFGIGYLLIMWDPNQGAGVTKQAIIDPDSGQEVPPEVAAQYAAAGAQVPPPQDVPDINPMTGQQKRAGDFVFQNLTPLDVVRDLNRFDADDQWEITRLYVNKWDLVADFPEFREQILDAKEVRRLNMNTDVIKSEREWRGERIPTDLIPVYHLWHKKTKAMPNGRWAMVLNDATDPLIVDDLPYDDVPMVKCMPGRMLRSPYGKSSLQMGLGLSDLLEGLYSAIATNNLATAMQLIAIPRDADFGLSRLVEGLGVIEYEAGPGGQNLPQAVQLTKSAPETFKVIEMVIKDLETITGVNAVARGNAPADWSGAMGALIQQQAIIFQSALAESYQEGIAQAGNILVDMLKRYADAPQVAEIVGKGKRFALQAFTGSDVENIHRVTVKSGNAQRQTDAFKLQMAQLLAQAGVEMSPKDIIEVVETGNLEQKLESEEAGQLLVRSENEAILDGENPPVAPFDNHALHLKENYTPLCSPEVRGPNGQAISAAGLGHQKDHLTMWAQLSLSAEGNAILFATGQQPLPPAIAAQILGLPPPMPPAPPPGSSPGAPGAGGPGASSDGASGGQPGGVAGGPSGTDHGGPGGHMASGTFAGPAAPVGSPMNPSSGRLPNQPNMPRNPMTGERAPRASS
jgi:hypothetical protein